MRYLFTSIGLIFLPLLFIPQGCSHEAGSTTTIAGAPHIRVRLLEDQNHIALAVNEYPRASLENQSGEKILGFPRGVAVPIILSGGGWRIGSLSMAPGTLVIKPGSEEGMRLNGVAYRGAFRLVPLGADKFDVINDVTVEQYLEGVVTREMFASWPIEALKSQAVVARTYALFEARSGGLSRYWDVYSDQRSQVYGGIDGETSQSREAVAETEGVVLAYGPNEGKIFKAYFSSCCGGVSQAAFDAFPGEAYIQPLAEQYRGACCSASKYFNWGPITISKDELARRFRAWAEHRAAVLGHPVPESKIAGIYRIDLDKVNRYGRPQRVMVTDTHNVQFSWAAEQLREAVNSGGAAPGTTLPSSFCKINGDPNSNSVTFYDGHGYGHGVGMCQYCARAQAAAGLGCERILAAAYPGAKLVRAY